MIDLFSSRSMEVSLDAIRRRSAGLDPHRQALLTKIPNSGDWGEFGHEHITMKDLAYLTAYTGHEFAILDKKHEDILVHGTVSQCSFDGELMNKLMSHRLIIFGHSHPGETVPLPSPEDRQALNTIGQTTESHLISGLTGWETTFTSDPFDTM